MSKNLTPEQYASFFKHNSTNGDNGHVDDVTVINLGIKITPNEPPEEQDVSDLEFKGYTKKFIEQPWQTEDIDKMLSYRADETNIGTANFSEMGSFKTSTGLWYVDRRIKAAPTEAKSEYPSVLIITSKAGKGTFLEAIPEILPEYTLLNIETTSLSLYKNGQMLKIPGIPHVPEAFAFPCICLAHYDVFSRSNRGKFTEKDDGMIDLENLKEKDWTQADYIINREWDMVWCDEFHRLKNREAKWTVNIKRIKTKVGRHGSTGTGFINRPDEIWSLLNWLDRKTFGSFWKFRERFCLVDDWDGYAKVVGVNPEHKEEFKQITRTIGVRRTLDETHKDIEAVTFEPYTVELNPVQRKMYNDLKGQLKALDQAGQPLYAANVLSLLQRLRQICVGTPEITEDYFDEILDRRVQKIKLVEPSSKLDQVMNIMEELRWDEDEKEPLVVFSCFKDPLELLKARLDKHNTHVAEMGLPDDFYYRYIHLDVKDKDVERYRKWHDEFPTLKYRVFMSTLQLGGESINLTPARHLVFLDRSWSPKDNAQGIGRIRRPGQKRTPVVIHINAKNTTDQHIEKVNYMKQGWFNEIFKDE